MLSGSFVEYINKYLDIGDIIVIIFAVVKLDPINFRPGHFCKRNGFRAWLGKVNMTQWPIWVINEWSFVTARIQMRRKKFRRALSEEHVRYQQIRH